MAEPRGYKEAQASLQKQIAEIRAEERKSAEREIDAQCKALIEHHEAQVGAFYAAIHDLLRSTPMDGEVFIALKDGLDGLARLWLRIARVL